MFAGQKAFRLGWISMPTGIPTTRPKPSLYADPPRIRPMGADQAIINKVSGLAFMI